MKKYKFVISQGIDKQETVEVEEKDLTQPQKDLLLGELINVFNNTPEELKLKFLQGCFDNFRFQKSDKFNEMQEKAIEAMITQTHIDIYGKK